MNKSIIKHVKAALITSFSGALILLYYRITRYGSSHFDISMLWKSLAIGSLLFVFLEAGRMISKKIIFPLSDKKQYAKAYIIIYGFSFLLSICIALTYRKLRYGDFYLKWDLFPKVIALSFGLIILMLMQIIIVRKTIVGGGKGAEFSHTELTHSLILMMIVGIVFIPVLSDYIVQHTPRAYKASSVIEGDVWKGEYGTVGEITKDTVVSQTFTCTSDCIYSLSMRAATYTRKLTGSIQLGLIDEESGDVIDEWQLDTSKIKDGSLFSVSIKEPYSKQNMRGRKLRINIESEDATGGNALTLYYMKGDYYENGCLFVNGEQYDGDLIIKVIGINGPTDYEWSRVYLCVLLAFFIEAMILYLSNHRAYRIMKDGEQVG